MAMGENHSNQMMSEINVTPLVDVMLVLLIIFMVSAPMMVQGVNVDLPQAATDALPSDEEPLIISINAQNEIFIGDDYQVTLPLLGDKLAAILAVKKGREVYLKASKQIPYGTVVQVMAEAKKAGVDRLGMITEPPQDGVAQGKPEGASQ